MWPTVWAQRRTKLERREPSSQASAGSPCLLAVCPVFTPRSWREGLPWTIGRKAGQKSGRTLGKIWEDEDGTELSVATRSQRQSALSAIVPGLEESAPFTLRMLLSEGSFFPLPPLTDRWTVSSLSSCLRHLLVSKGQGPFRRRLVSLESLMIGTPSLVLKLKIKKQLSKTTEAAGAIPSSSHFECWLGLSTLKQPLDEPLLGFSLRNTPSPWGGLASSHAS